MIVQLKKILIIPIILLLTISFLPNINAVTSSIKKETKSVKPLENDLDWLKNRCGYIRENISDNERIKVETNINLPDEFDWRDYNSVNWMTPVKNQGACGSCSAFAVNAAIEALINIQNNDPDIDRDLSEAHIFFCSGYDCSSGSGFHSLINFIKDDGVCDEISFPYASAEAGFNLECNVSSEWRWNGVSVKSYKYLEEDIENIKNALVEHGPLVASMEVYQNFELYMGGVYDEIKGSFVGYHAVCIVGYNDEQGYWICKNSWGKLWGEKGYFRIKYGMCGIEEDVKLIGKVYDLHPGSPYIPEKPSGTSVVKPGYYGDYKTKTYDPNGNDIRYLWDWNGDYIVDHKTSYFSSGEECQTVNKWDEPGTYEVRVRAENSKGILSDWSPSFKVTVTKSKNKEFFSVIDIIKLIFEKWNLQYLVIK